jgi:HD-GYP domain-containing protein (c-di-GMP phosphodiesterase class II)
MTEEKSGHLFSKDPAIHELLAKVVGEVGIFAENQLQRIRELVDIGLALSAEKNLDSLLEKIVLGARHFTNADGGTLYIRRQDEDLLDFAIVQNETLDIRMGGTGERISWDPVPLTAVDGSENHQNVSAHCALVGKAVNIRDVYDAEGFDFEGTKKFDRKTSYRSQSMLVIPMRDHEDEVIGVLQLLNARNPATGETVEFLEREVAIITSLGSQAAIALTNIRLIKGLEDLLHAIVKSIAGAIDEKSPYTAGHIFRVADLAERLMEEVNAAREGKFAEVSFSPDDMNEIRMSAWMHDVGKIVTPEYVVDKATKLETIYDRIEVVRCRIELIKKELEITRLKKALGGEAPLPAGESEEAEEVKTLDESLAFLEEINRGGEFMADEKIEKVREMSKRIYEMAGTRSPLLSDDEIENLVIRKGTLNDRERDIINDHVRVSRKMLESLPFPKKLKNVPLFAGMHHEKLDGSGYPDGLAGDDIPLQARILAVADIFEALSAADRPYKQGKKLSEVMRILQFMVKDAHLDGDLCDLIVESGVIRGYADEGLKEWQRDDFEWKGKTYSYWKGKGKGGEGGARRPGRRR